MLYHFLSFFLVISPKMLTFAALEGKNILTNHQLAYGEEKKE